MYLRIYISLSIIEIFKRVLGNILYIFY